MKLGLSGVVAALVCAGLVACNGCQSPSPAPSPPLAPNDYTVTQELLLAQCWVMPDGGLDAAVAIVAAEHALPSRQPWVDCLYDGGNPQSCNVPCSH
jgi:hypothetical protein